MAKDTLKTKWRFFLLICIGAKFWLDRHIFFIFFFANFLSNVIEIINDHQYVGYSHLGQCCKELVAYDFCEIVIFILHFYFAEGTELPLGKYICFLYINCTY